MTDVAPRPVIQAVLLADRVRIDPRTGKQDVVGVFAKIAAARFPTSLGRETFMFLSITNITGPVRVWLRYRSLEDGVVLMESEAATAGSIAAASPTETVSIVLRLGVLPIPHPGVYVHEVLYDGVVIGSYRVSVMPS